MPKLKKADLYTLPAELALGTRLNDRVPGVDQKRQRAEVEEILQRLRQQPGVILADEVGMGKTFVALAVAYSVAVHSPRGPALIMVPPNLIDKWEQDLKAFCALYLDAREPMRRDDTTTRLSPGATAVRYGVARHSVELMGLLDDSPQERCHLIFVGQGSMARRQTEKWVRLALIAEALRRHGRGGADRLIKVKKQIYRFLARLLWAIGEEKANELGEHLWHKLLRTAPSGWKKIYNDAFQDPTRHLTDDPVPKSVYRTLDRMNLANLAESLKGMPIRAVGGDDRVEERIKAVRSALRDIEDQLWSDLLAKARWRSPLLIMDEAHHLKNPETSLARSIQNPVDGQVLRIGDGAMAHRFDRMVFLTATPFQLGHRELAKVMDRFGDVRWDENELGLHKDFVARMAALRGLLDKSQHTAVAFQRSWSRLRTEDCGEDPTGWWLDVQNAPRDSLNGHQRAVLDAYKLARDSRNDAEAALRSWILRHNKGARWESSGVVRRERVAGGRIVDETAVNGLPIPGAQLLPFFLAARGAAAGNRDLLGEALSSSFEAFRFTRLGKSAAKDGSETEVEGKTASDLSGANWFLEEFDEALARSSGAIHPKIFATVKKVVDLWEKGEKVLVFAFYRRTCQSLRFHIGREIERRVTKLAIARLNGAEASVSEKKVEELLDRIQRNFFDAADAPGRRALDAALGKILADHSAAFLRAGVSTAQQEGLMDVMRRFLRVETSLVRCFPMAQLGKITPAEAVTRMLAEADGSGITWEDKFHSFVNFLTEQCSTTSERSLFLDAAQQTRTGRIRVELEDDETPDGAPGSQVLANVQVATGRTPHDARARLMRAFNTPFFPDIFVCSEVMGEGVDLQRFCRYVIHHDLAWNPSTIEQRTGRIDRLGCKAEGRSPITIYLPYLSGAADERQFQVMTQRERWFRVVMGQEEVAKLINQSSSETIPLPENISDSLNYNLSLVSLHAPPKLP